MSVFISWMETVQPKGPTLYTQQVIVQLAIEMITQLQFCQSHSIKIYVKLRMCPWQMGGPHSVVLCCSEKWLCLLPLYLLPPLLKHLLHQPPALPPLFSEVEKILVMFFCILLLWFASFWRAKAICYKYHTKSQQQSWEYCGKSKNQVWTPRWYSKVMNKIAVASPDVHRELKKCWHHSHQNRTWTKPWWYRFNILPFFITYEVYEVLLSPWAHIAPKFTIFTMINRRKSSYDKPST